MRYETKDSIWHPDFKTRLEFWSNIHSLEWKSTQGSIMRYATRDSVWQLVKYFCPFWRVYRIEEHTKIPLLDMWQKILKQLYRTTSIDEIFHSPTAYFTL